MSDTHYLVPLGDVERELNRHMKALQADARHPLQRARMSNLVIFCNSLETSIEINEQVPLISAHHPARVILLVGEPGTPRELTARVTVRRILEKGSMTTCSEMVTLHAGGINVDRLPFAVRALLIGDLPLNLWWQTPVPPPYAGALLYELSEYAQQVIYDSLGWPDPVRGMAATASWLEQTERGRVGAGMQYNGPWRVSSDLNWRRLKYWRRLLAQSLSEASAPGAAKSVREIHIEHGPHAVIQAWLLASWLTRVLGWRVGKGKATPGVELAWRFTSEQGEVWVRIRRLEEGPPEVRRVRLSCTLDGKAVTLVGSADGPQRLSMQLEGVAVSARTITVPPRTGVDMIARQLSDRERDPVFRESMAVAQVMAQSVLV